MSDLVPMGQAEDVRGIAMRDATLQIGEVRGGRVQVIERQIVVIPCACGCDGHGRHGVDRPFAWTFALMLAPCWLMALLTLGQVDDIASATAICFMLVLTLGAAYLVNCTRTEVSEEE